MMKSRKSAIEVQFNWIFVLVIGAVILIVFFGFTFKQKRISEDIIQSSTVNALDAITKSAQSSAGEVSIVTVAKEEVGIECNRIRLGGASKQYENLILFSPKKLETTRLITHTMSLNIPYRVSNLLFVTSPDVRYILIGNYHEATDLGNLARFVNKSIPKEISKEVYYINRPTKADGSARDPADKHYSEITNQKDKKVRVVIIGSLPNNWNSVRDKFKALKEDYSELIVNSNNGLNFWQYENGALVAKSSSFIEESIMGAVYSDDIEQYNCNMQNVFKTISRVSNVYIGKLKALSAANVAKVPQQCEDIYGELYKQETSGSNKYLDTIAIANFPAGIVGIKSAMTFLNQKNLDLQKKSCPLVY